MLKKLKSGLKNQASRLRNFSPIGFINLISLIRPIIFVFLLFWTSQTHSFLATAVFFAGSLYFYFSSPHFSSSPTGSRELLSSFLIILIASFALTFYSQNLFYFLTAGILFFLILGVKNHLFRNISLIYQILNNFLLFFTLVFFFFSAVKFTSAPDKIVASGFISFFFLIFFLIREFLVWQFVPLRIRRQDKTKINSFAAVFSFLIIQFARAIMFLPIGFLNSAALALVMALMLKDLITAHFNKTLDQFLIMKNITIVLIFGLVIFMASRWQP